MAGYHIIELDNDNKITISSESELMYNGVTVGKFIKYARVMIEKNVYYVLVGQDTTVPSVFLDEDNAKKVYDLYGRVRALIDDPVKDMHLACIIKKVGDIYVGMVLGLYVEHQKAKLKLMSRDSSEMDGSQKVICKC